MHNYFKIYQKIQFVNKRIIKNNPLKNENLI